MTCQRKGHLSLRLMIFQSGQEGCDIEILTEDTADPSNEPLATTAAVRRRRRWVCSFRALAAAFRELEALASAVILEA